VGYGHTQSPLGVVSADAYAGETVALRHKVILEGSGDVPFLLNIGGDGVDNAATFGASGEASAGGSCALTWAGNTAKLTGSVGARVARSGTPPSFDAPEVVTVIGGSDSTTSTNAVAVAEVQRVVVASLTGDDLEGYFELDFSSIDDGAPTSLYGSASSQYTALATQRASGAKGGTGRRLTLAANATAEDMEYLLESLPTVGDVTVTRSKAEFLEGSAAKGGVGVDGMASPFKSGYEWAVTFHSNLGDQPLLLIEPNPPFLPLRAKGGVVAFVEELVKGVPLPREHQVSGLRVGVSYAGRISAANRVGYGPTTESIVSLEGSDGGVYPRGSNAYGEGMVPYSATVSAAPGAPLALGVEPLSTSQLRLAFSESEQRGSDVDTYRVEWSTDPSFGTTEVKAVTVVNRMPQPKDSAGRFTLAYGGVSTTALSPDATADEVAEALSDLGTTAGPVTVTRSTETQFPGYGFTWSVTFTNDVGPLVKSGYLCRSCVTGFNDRQVNLTSLPPSTSISESLLTNAVASGKVSSAMDILSVGDVIHLSSPSFNGQNSTDINIFNGSTTVGADLHAPCVITVSGVTFVPSSDEHSAEGTAVISVTNGHSCNVTSKGALAAAAEFQNSAGLQVDPADLFSTSGNGSLSAWTTELRSGVVGADFGTLDLSAQSGPSSGGHTNGLAATIGGSRLAYGLGDVCGSTVVGSSSRVQRVSLGSGGAFWDYSERVTNGGYRLQLGHEVTSCLSHNATAIEVQTALGKLGAVARHRAGVSVRTVRYDREELFYPVDDHEVLTDGLGFDYEVTFHGDYPAPGGEWPNLGVPPVHFGTAFKGEYRDCPIWELADGLPAANLTAAATSLRQPGECSDGRRDQQTVLALAYSPLGGSFTVSFRGSPPVAISVFATAKQFEEKLNEALALHGDERVRVVDRVAHRDHPTGRFGTAWVVEIEPSASTLAQGGAADKLSVDDSFTTGQDAAVVAYPAVTMITTAQRDDLRGHFRFQFGSEVSERLSYQATSAKVVEALQRLDQVASVEVLSGNVGFGVGVQVPQVQLTNGSSEAWAYGDWTSTLTKGDELDFTAAKRKSVADFGYFGFYSERLYGATPTSFESNGVQIESLRYDNASKRTFFQLDEIFAGNTSASADASVGNAEVSLRRVEGLVKLEEPPQVKFTYPSVEGRRTWLELCDGCVAKYNIALNQTITVERQTYVVFGIGIDGVPSCGDDCLLLDRPFLGTFVSHASPFLEAFPATLYANTTHDLSSANGDHLAVGDRFWVANSQGELDELTVEEFGHFGVSLSGNFSERYLGASGYASAHGLRRRLVFRALANNADLDTFQVVPESDWRGTEARVEVRRPKGVATGVVTIGNDADVQTLAIRCDTAAACAALRNASDGSSFGNATFTLSLDHRTTAPLPWGASAAFLRDALVNLRSVDHVAVERSGSETDAAFHFGYVYTVRFWGGVDHGARTHVPSLVFHPGDAMKGSSSGVHAFVRTVRQGSAHAASNPTYVALGENTTYYHRVKARNGEGWSAYSNMVAQTTVDGAQLPSQPTAVSLGAVPPSAAGGVAGYNNDATVVTGGVYSESTALSLHFSPPLEDGGSPVSHYRVEWAPNANFLAPSPANSAAASKSQSVSFNQAAQGYGSTSLQVVAEVQSLVVDFRSGADLAVRGGTFFLKWGGQRTADLPWDIAADALAIAVQGISGLEAVGENPVHVTKQAFRHGFKWDATFHGRRGDLGEMEVDGTELFGDDARAHVVEKVRGSADIVPGEFTYEEQAIAVEAHSLVDGYFRLTFEGKETANMTYDESRESFKTKLEALGTIQVASVKRVLTNRQWQLFTWHVRFAYLKHETVIGAGDVGLFLVSNNRLGGNGAQVAVTQTVRGTPPLRFDLGGLVPGTTYFVRVAAQNRMGFGPASVAATGVPQGQPAPPSQATLAVAGGSSLDVAWALPPSDGGSSITGYAVEWFSAPGTPEVQIVTTSADKGTVEVQTLSIGADADGISGYFQLSFRGETTDNLKWDAPATGGGSVKAKLERLTTIGTVDVTRDYSRTVVPNLRVDVNEGADNFTATSDSLTTPSKAGLLLNDLLFVAGVAVRVRDFSPDGRTVYLGRVNNFRVAKPFREGDGAKNVAVEKWAYGYSWAITFTSHNGDQPLIVPTPSDSWGGTNPTLAVTETLRGLQPISGSFRLGFQGHRTQLLPHDSSAAVVEAALEGLHTLSDVTVSRHTNGFGFNWLVTFVSELGPQPLLVSHGAQLTGPSAAVYTSRETVGVLPANYCESSDSSVSGNMALVPAAATKHQIVGLTNGLPYYVTVRAINDQGLGSSAVPSPARLAPVAAPGAPLKVEILPLSDLSLKVVWAAPLDNGGMPIVTYRVEWDTAEGFPSIETSGYAADVSVSDPATFAHCNGLYYFNVPVTKMSAWMPRFARVRAYNTFAWGSNGVASGSAAPTLRAPGYVQQPTLVATSGVGLLVEWAPPSPELAVYGGDGGSAITEYLIEYDLDPHFDGPATEITVRMPHPYELLIGGRELMTGEESTALDPGVEYYVRVTAFNGVGYGPAAVTSPPKLLPQDQLPTQPEMGVSRTVDESAVQVFFEPPDRDGGEPLSSFRIDYDLGVRDLALSSGDGWQNVNGSTFEPRGGFVDMPVVRALQSVELKAAELMSEEQWVIASVAVTNERQTILTNVTGVDEVQMITVMADEVIDTVMTVTTTASDYNEEQLLKIDATDLNEVQTFRTDIDAVLEMQTLTVSATRRNEIQQVTIELTGNTSTPGAVEYLEASLGGTFQLEMDTRSCQWCDVQSVQTSASISAPLSASNLNASLAALSNLGAGSLEVSKKVKVLSFAEIGGVLRLQYNVTFVGDGVRGDIDQLIVATNQLTNTTKV